jgi:SAM-dependent methyltransferase
MKAMARLLEKYKPPRRADEEVNVVDVGSLQRGGTYRGLIRNRDWNYTGVDLREGQNVDHVVPELDRWNAKDIGGPFNIAISGQCFEHARWPWQLMRQIKSVVVPGGLIIVIAPHTWQFQEHPVDCYRFWPTGMESICEWARVEVLEVGKNENDTFVAARVPTARQLDSEHYAQNKQQ